MEMRRILSYDRSFVLSSRAKLNLGNSKFQRRVETDAKSDTNAHIHTRARARTQRRKILRPPFVSVVLHGMQSSLMRYVTIARKRFLIARVERAKRSADLLSARFTSENLIFACNGQLISLVTPSLEASENFIKNYIRETLCEGMISNLRICSHRCILNLVPPDIFHEKYEKSTKSLLPKI